MKILSITAVATLLLLSTSCSARIINRAYHNKPNFIFPKGDLGPAENFTGKAWNAGLVENDIV